MLDVKIGPKTMIFPSPKENEPGEPGFRLRRVEIWRRLEDLELRSKPGWLTYHINLCAPGAFT